MDILILVKSYRFCSAVFVALGLLFLPQLVVAQKASAPANLPTIKSNSDKISIRDGDVLKKDSWNLAPEAKPDVYETSVKKGAKKKVEFITGTDQISFDVEAGKTYDFIIQKGDVKCYTQIKANELKFWNDANFWESPSIKTLYRANITDEEKIAGLSKFWSEAKYNFINFDLVPDLDWDKTYLEYIPKVLATKSTLEYYRVLQMFSGKLKDTHTNVFFPKEVQDEISAAPAIETRLIEDRVVIVNIYDPKLKNEGLAVGQEITAIDGVPVKEYAAEKIAPYVSESTSQAQDTSVYQYFLLDGSTSNSVELTLKDAKGTTFKKSLQRLTRQELNKLPVVWKPFEITVLPNNIVWVKVNTMADGAAAQKLFAEKFSEISQGESLILDLRENGGGSTSVGYGILSFLIDKPFKGSKWYTREYHPSFRPWGKQDNSYGEEAREVSLDEIGRMRGEVQPFLKPVIVLSSPRTGSAAEDFLVAFKPLKRGLIIGEASTGSTGQPLSFSLPGGGSARICSKHDAFADGTEFVGVGVVPDITIAPKVTDYTEGKDAVLERALQELRKN